MQYLQQNDPAVEDDKSAEIRDKYSHAFVDGYLPSVVVPSASRIHEIRVCIGALDPFDGTLCHGEEQRGVLSSKGGPVWSGGLMPVLAQVFIARRRQ